MLNKKTVTVSLLAVLVALLFIAVSYYFISKKISADELEKNGQIVDKVVQQIDLDQDNFGEQVSLITVKTSSGYDFFL